MTIREFKSLVNARDWHSYVELESMNRLPMLAADFPEKDLDREIQQVIPQMFGATYQPGFKILYKD